MDSIQVSLMSLLFPISSRRRSEVVITVVVDAPKVKGGSGYGGVVALLFLRKSQRNAFVI